MYRLGIDGGGSKCKAVLSDITGKVLSEATSGPANPVRSVTETTSSIVEAAVTALQRAGLKPNLLSRCVAGIGLAGVNLPQFQTAMQQWQHPFAACHITTDLHIACIGAHASEDGGVIILGTGSSGIAVCRGQVTEVGGHGFLVGDVGSGAWMGNAAVRYCLEVFDGIAGTGTLFDALCAQTESHNAHTLAMRYVQAQPSVFAQLAPLVLTHAKQQDAAALSIVLQGANYVNRLAQRLLATGINRLSLIGGISPLMQGYLASEVQAHIVAPLHTPELGALLFSQQHTR